MATPKKKTTIRINCPARPREGAGKRGIVIGPDAEGNPIIKRHGDTLDIPSDITRNAAAILLGNGKAEMVADDERAPRPKKQTA